VVIKRLYSRVCFLSYIPYGNPCVQSDCSRLLVCARAHVGVFTCTCWCVHVHMLVCARAHVGVCTCTCWCVHVHVLVCACAHVGVCTCTCWCVYVHMLVCACAHVGVCVCTCLHSWSCAPLLSCLVMCCSIVLVRVTRFV